MPPEQDRLDVYRARAEELERAAADIADGRLRWRQETLARAYRAAIAAADRGQRDLDQPRNPQA